MDLTKHIILLDRDGVINQDSDQYVKSAAEFVFLPGSLDALVALKKAQFSIYVITNQSGIGRGYFSQHVLAEMHNKLQQALSPFNVQLDGFYFCPHTPDDHCDCRKPKPGMLDQLSKAHQLDLTGVPFVGDAKRDLLAAKAAKAQPVLVKTGKGLKTIKDLDDLPNTPVFENLLAFSQHVLGEPS